MQFVSFYIQLLACNQHAVQSWNINYAYRLDYWLITLKICFDLYKEEKHLQETTLTSGTLSADKTAISASASMSAFNIRLRRDEQHSR